MTFGRGGTRALAGGGALPEREIGGKRGQNRRSSNRVKVAGQIPSALRYGIHTSIRVPFLSVSGNE